MGKRNKKERMTRLIWRKEKQIEKMRSFFPKQREKPRVDERSVLGGIVWVMKDGVTVERYSLRISLI
jgi:hypothetical protein